MLRLARDARLQEAVLIALRAHQLLVRDPMRLIRVRALPLLADPRCSSGSSPRTTPTSEFPSNARMCVAMRSRNQRSCEITTAQPAKSSSASSSARSVSTSRSFVGSSSSSRLPPDLEQLREMQPIALSAREIVRPSSADPCP